MNINKTLDQVFDSLEAAGMIDSHVSIEEQKATVKPRNTANVTDPWLAAVIAGNNEVDYTHNFLHN